MFSPEFPSCASLPSWGALQTAGTTYQVGADTDLRAQFINNSKLTNTLDRNFRAISDHWPVFAFAHDLGTVTEVTDPVVFSIGHARDPAVQYIILNGGTQNRSSYFWSAYPKIGDAVRELRYERFKSNVLTSTAADQDILA